MCHYHRRKSAFTIVELLVVIVVIGILATITIVSYNGITKRAALASLQSDLANAATKLKSYQTLYGSYPTLDANNCPTAPTVDSNYCLKLSPGSSIAVAPFAGYIPNNSTTPQTFSLTLSSNDIQGIITESSKPSVLTPAPLDPVAD
ncbi:MAG: prepilin-type N-terminal cleavage/methylation domain-containing protein, partial [Candidatus Saccharimonadales bacterium]